jgi:hypothetical protein
MEDSNTKELEPEFLITTVDNPFNPFTESDEWRVWDTTYGYNTYERLVELGHFDSDMTEDEEEEEYKRAMIRLLRIHPMYIKVPNEEGIEVKIKKLREVLLEKDK